MNENTERQFNPGVYQHSKTMEFKWNFKEDTTRHFCYVSLRKHVGKGHSSQHLHTKGFLRVVCANYRFPGKSTNPSLNASTQHRPKKIRHGVILLCRKNLQSKFYRGD